MTASGIRWKSDPSRELPLRRWIRENAPAPARGPVVEDLDLILRRYGTCNGTDVIGSFCLIDHKACNAYRCGCTQSLVPVERPKQARGRLGTAQENTFGLIDDMLRSSPSAERYWGFWLYESEHEDIELSRWHFLNGTEVEWADVASLLVEGRSLAVPPYRFRALDFGGSS